MKRKFIKKPVLASGLLKSKTFHIQDIDSDIIVEECTRKELLSWLDDYVDNFDYEWFDPSDQAFSILYTDGSYDIVGEGYDGHHIKRTGIASIVYDNPSTSMVYGNYEINEYGVVSPAFQTEIHPNIVEVN